MIYAGFSENPTFYLFLNIVKHCFSLESAPVKHYVQEFSVLSEADRALLVSSNLGLVTTLATAAMFPPHLLWNSQLCPLLGEAEVSRAILLNSAS